MKLSGRRYRKVAILAGGAFGTAIAQVVAEAGSQAVVWARRLEAAEEHLRALKNRSERICTTACLASAVQGAEVVVLAAPTGAIRSLCLAIRDHLPADVPIVCLAKGIDETTLRFNSQTVGHELPGTAFAAVGGPTFAQELVGGEPTALVVASTSPVGQIFANTLACHHLRTDLSDDVIGVEVNGLMKNITAIACGFCQALGHGENTRAAVATRGLADSAELVEAMGGKSETLAGFSGFGDFVLSCTSVSSRNFYYGSQWLQHSESTASASGKLTEGLNGVGGALRLAERYHLKLPTLEFVHDVVREGAELRTAFEKFWAR